MKGSKACKETFPKLLTSLRVALTPEVVRSGFRGTDIIILSRKHVLSKVPAATDLELEVVDRDSCQTIKCTHCGHDMSATPVLKMRLTSVFASVLQANAHRPKLGKRKNAKI